MASSLRGFIPLLVLALVWTAPRDAQAVSVYGLPMNGQFIIAGELIGPGYGGSDFYLAFITATPMLPSCSVWGCEDPFSWASVSTSVSGAVNGGFSASGPFDIRHPPETQSLWGFLTNGGDRSLLISTRVEGTGIYSSGIGLGVVLSIELPDGLFLVETPLPAALPLLVTGLAALALFARRRRAMESRAAAPRPVSI